MVVLYTTHCPRCAVVEMKLKEKKIEYIECTDVEEMRRLGFLSVPYIKVNDKLLNFSESVAWIGRQ